MRRSFHVYIVANKSRRLYTGFSNDLPRRIWEHKTHALPNSFTDRYHIDRLVYIAELPGPLDAIAWEKTVKGWTRAKRVALIQEENPGWDDLAAEWFDPVEIERVRAENLTARRNAKPLSS